MPVPAVKLRIFVASPGDVKEERDALDRVVAELNLTALNLISDVSVTIELVRWETHTFPEMGRPQGVINEQIGSYDIFVGIMWKRFGTPTGVAGSGTEEEFRIAYQRWVKEKSPKIMMYFREPPPLKLLEEIDQYRKVVQFRDELSNLGLIGSYSDQRQFADVVRPDLIGAIATILRSRRPAASTVHATAERVGDLALKTGLKEQAFALATQYEQLRTDMPAGTARTRKMELVMTQMRTLGTFLYPLLPELTVSDSPGRRLLGIAILQATPTPDYFEWLADRQGNEQPFVGYHAAVAMLAAARSPDPAGPKRLCAALALARRLLREKGLGEGADRETVLRTAEDELGCTSM